jgi:predicted RNase H-like HicB family nuclease
VSGPARPPGLPAVFSPSGWRSRYRGDVAESRTITVTVPVVVERDEDGVWCAHAQLRPGVGAHGEGETEEEAIDDLREALKGLIEEFGVPRELSVTLAA